MDRPFLKHFLFVTRNRLEQIIRRVVVKFIDVCTSAGGCMCHGARERDTSEIHHFTTNKKIQKIVYERAFPLQSRFGTDVAPYSLENCSILPRATN